MTKNRAPELRENGPATPTPGRHFLLATDGSHNACRACDFAAELAAELHAIVTVAVVAVDYDDPIMPWEEGRTEHHVPDSQAGEWANPVTERLRSDGIEVTQVILSGHAADALITEADTRAVDLIVIGCHGRGRTEARLGSVVEELARRSARPVLLVP
jgi:nucleotide-binding universal stress UspA family protein